MKRVDVFVLYIRSLPLLEPLQECSVAYQSFAYRRDLIHIRLASWITRLINVEITD